MPTRGLPNVSHKLPKDLVEFYQACGGLKLFQGQDYAIDIVSSEDFVLANPIIIGGLYPEDISSNWYVVAKGAVDEIITIDLADERRGRCYDSFYDVHGVVGSCPIIAMSFTELLLSLIESGGGYWFWLKDSFVSHGDAYD
ncbi:SMI1/KNR4 family protein [Pseudomonas sp. GLN_6]|uniref:SMI1/KNR4 family protein n=1 Tax=Pseudomonas sp. GLN_6 TaxID=3367183 RepID=UPI003709F832